eukprot:3111519-Lingulodinium_polyedra.AAC.1
MPLLTRPREELRLRAVRRGSRVATARPNWRTRKPDNGSLPPWSSRPRGPTTARRPALGPG